MLELQQTMLFCDLENLIAMPCTSFPHHHLNNCTPVTPNKMKAAADAAFTQCRAMALQGHASARYR
jgi:hypothetical protein